MVDERDAPLGEGVPEALSRPAEAAASAPAPSAVPLARAEKNLAAAVAPSSPLGAPVAGGASPPGPAAVPGRQGGVRRASDELRSGRKVSRVCAPLFKVCSLTRPALSLACRDRRLSCLRERPSALACCAP